jgi:pimeloyl-ACP methyl ester carboxylesterase
MTWHDLFVKADDVSFSGSGVELSGTVMLPDAALECPGLVLVGGSGPSDRHNDGLFDSLSDHLVRSGVAVLAYDKRGAGRSTGSWERATLDQLAADARFAVEALSTPPAARTC